MKYQNTRTIPLGHLMGLLGFLMLLSISCCTWAQVQQRSEYVDESVQQAFSSAVRVYDKYIDKNAMVYSGISYAKNYGGIKDHPFFLEDYWEPGNVNYDGNSYDSIDLMYDVYNDLLIVENFSMSGLPSPIQLFAPKVNSFSLHGYHFVCLLADTLTNIKGGYYNLMYDGQHSKVLVKRRKELVKSNDINSVREMFVEKDKFYILKGGTMYQVKKRRSILKVLADKNKALKVFIRKNGLNFKTNTDEQIARVVAYYDSIQ